MNTMFERLRHRSPCVALLAVLLCAGPLFAQSSPSLKLGVPPGTYAPDLDAQPKPQKKEEPAPKKKSGDGKDPKELEGVTVKGKRNPAGKLPTLGTDKPRDKDLIDKAKEWYDSHPKDPNQLNEDQKAFLEHATQNNDPNHPAATGGTPTREAGDYADPIEAAGKSLKKR
jgi:hypothetical protein